MFTILVVFVFVVVAIPLGLAALGLLFKGEDLACDPEWELYQQRYD